MSIYGVISQVLEIVVALALAPLLTGWVNQWRAWLQNKSAPSLWQPYRLLHKLFNKDSVVADHASPLFRAVPYIVFGCMALASSIVPTLSTDLPLAPAADAIALVGLFALARVFISLAAMDIGTSFGSLGARREMLIGFLAEPALLMVLFSASLISKSTSLTTMVETLAHRELAIYPGPGVRRRGVHHGVAGRERAGAGGQPGHAPGTDDDPRGADPGVFRPAPRADRMGGQPEAVRLLLHRPGPVLPLGRGRGRRRRWPCCWRCRRWCVQAGDRRHRRWRVLETLAAKMRIFRVPEFLATAFLLAVIGMLVHILLGDMSELLAQFVNLLGALLLMLAFAMISQRRILSLINLFTLQGADAGGVHRGGRLRDRPAAPVPVGGTDFRAEGGADPGPAAPDHRPPEDALGRRDADQHPDHHADRHRWS